MLTCALRHIINNLNIKRTKLQYIFNVILISMLRFNLFYL